MASLTVCINTYTATGNHLPYGITQCYLPPGRGDFPAKALLQHQAIYLCQMLNTYCPTRWLQLSGAGLLVKPETSNETSDPAFAVAAATTWNPFSQEIRTATITEQFCHILKTRLFNSTHRMAHLRCLRLISLTGELRCHYTSPMID